MTVGSHKNAIKNKNVLTLTCIMMIRSLSIGAVAGMLATTSVLAVPTTVTIDRQSGYYSGSGGEFTITVNQNISYASYAGSSIATAGTSFQTFCVENLDYIAPGSTYTAFVASQINGNNGTKTLSIGAAYLYAQFLAGTLGGVYGYNYTPGVGRSAMAGLLPQTIWWTMGEMSSPGGCFVTDLANAGITTPSAAISGAYYETKIGGTIYDVAVLNLGLNGGTDSQDQDQLIAWTRPVPHDSRVPDGGTTVSMLGMGLAGLAFIGRRFGKRQTV